MNGIQHEYVNTLQCRVKALTLQVREFRTGEKYVAMKSGHIAQLNEKDREIRGLRAQLADANARNVSMREEWMHVYDDIAREHKKELEKKDREHKETRELLLGEQKRHDDTRDKLLEKTRECYAVKAELEEERDKSRKLTAQINRDHENSSKPSSLIPNRKKITNNREKSGKSPGGQPGHAHHPRKWHESTAKVEIPAPKEYADNPNYVLTGRIIRKQLVDIRVEVDAVEFSTPEYRDLRTGICVHAEFPGGLVNEVTYGGNAKSLAFLLNNYGNVSIGKVSELISELTGGKLNMSTGMVCGLSKEFSRKTAAEQKKAFADMLLAPAMNVDLTTASVNGESANVVVCATQDNVLYFPRVHKGHKAVAGTPIEDYLGILIHDHDLTFYSYGSAHQECLDHVLRYLKDSIINEPGLIWNREMRELIREMIHFRKGLDPEDRRNPDEIDPARVKALEAKYDKILEAAKAEYEYEPPLGKFAYRDGHNLSKRMRKYRAEHLLFLHDHRVTHSNSLSERLLRVYKRKQHQVMSFRSFGGLGGLCDALGAIATLRAQGKSLYESVAAIFDRSMGKVQKSAS
jgi:hypothetical protein